MTLGTGIHALRAIFVHERLFVRRFCSATGTIKREFAPLFTAHVEKVHAPHNRPAFRANPAASFLACR